MQNELAKKVMEVIRTATEPLETKEIEEKLKDFSRAKILYRLHNLRGEGLIKGKRVGPGKGAWIWWKKGAFEPRRTVHANTKKGKRGYG